MADNVISIDLEEWFHVCGIGGALARDNWDRLPSRVEPTTFFLLDLLDRLDIRATWFVVGWIAERYPRLVQAVHAAGHELGSHGYAHQRAYDLGPQAFRADTQASLAAIAATGAPRPRAFRAPEWSINDRSLWALEGLVREGFAIDASMAPVKIVGDVNYPRVPHRLATPAGSLVEVPPLVVDRFRQVMPIGWGWALRMSSPARVLRAIDAANQAGSPAVITVHPWEIDDDPPRTRLPAPLHFAHYFRLHGFRQRLAEILAGASFGPISSVRLLRPAP